MSLENKENQTKVMARKNERRKKENRSTKASALLGHSRIKLPTSRDAHIDLE